VIYYKETVYFVIFSHSSLSVPSDQKRENLLPEHLLMPSDAGVPGLADLLSRQHYEMSGLRTQP